MYVGLYSFYPFFLLRVTILLTISVDDEDALEELISEEQRFENFIEEMEGARDGNQREEITYDDDDYDILFASLSPGASGNNSQSHDRMDTSHG